MTRKARSDGAGDPFSSARSEFERMIDSLRKTAPATQAETERAVIQQGTELMRQLVQARLDLLFERERADYAGARREAGVEIRARARELETQVGRLVVQRFGIKAAGEKAARFPMDEQLNLPADLYSLPLRERIADEARRGAWEQVVQQIDQRTGGRPKAPG